MVTMKMTIRWRGTLNLLQLGRELSKVTWHGPGGSVGHRHLAGWCSRLIPGFLEFSRPAREAGSTPSGGIRHLSGG